MRLLESFQTAVSQNGCFLNRAVPLVFACGLFYIGSARLLNFLYSCSWTAAPGDL
jgi:hypothetical protein